MCCDLNYALKQKIKDLVKNGETTGEFIMEYVMLHINTSGYIRLCKQDNGEHQGQQVIRNQAEYRSS